MSLLVVLIPYSIVVTAWAILFTVLYFNRQPPIHELEMLLDLGNPPAKRVGASPTPVLSVRSYDRVKADAPLPAHLVTALGKTIRVGDLEVTPVSVEQKRVLFKDRTGRHQSEMAQHESLVLSLQLKNVSKDVEFRPTDVYFDHKWKDGNNPPNIMPYTYLEVPSTGKRYCGPFKWDPVKNRKLPPHAAGSEEYIEGQEQDNKVLQPGEEVKTAILTDPDDQVPNELRNYSGKLLWRLQLRRGLVIYKEREFPVAAVIGVRFDKAEIVKK